MDTVSAYCIIAWSYGGMRAQENVHVILQKRLSMGKEKSKTLFSIDVFHRYGARAFAM